MYNVPPNITGMLTAYIVMCSVTYLHWSWGTPLPAAGSCWQVSQPAALVL